MISALHTWLQVKRLCLTSDGLGGLQGAKDFRVDADLHAACQADAEQVCKDVEPGEGRVQDCLVSLQAARCAAGLQCRGRSALQCSMLAHITAEKNVASRQVSGRLKSSGACSMVGMPDLTAFGTSTHLAELLQAARYRVLSPSHVSAACQSHSSCLAADPAT